MHCVSVKVKSAFNLSLLFYLCKRHVCRRRHRKVNYSIAYGVFFLLLLLLRSDSSEYAVLEISFALL